jgi:hypothetical protein
MGAALIGDVPTILATQIPASISSARSLAPACGFGHYIIANAITVLAYAASLC